MNLEDRILKLLNEWLFNVEDQAGEKLDVIDAHDFKIIIPEIVKLSKPKIMTLEEKLEKIEDFMIGKTIFEEPEKRWIACDYYEAAPDLADYKILPVLYSSTLDDLLDQVIAFNKGLDDSAN